MHVEMMRATFQISTESKKMSKAKHQFVVYRCKECEKTSTDLGSIHAHAEKHRGWFGIQWPWNVADPEELDELVEKLSVTDYEVVADSSEAKEDDPIRDPEENELEKIAQVTLIVGPDHARDLGQPQEGDMFVSPETVYRFENSRWEDLDVDTSWLIDHLKAYALPAGDSK